ncbi:MAG TPA: SdrD B-like domain-containing protein [Saprospiraceae bacterium]|nr:SdrD B-like domain-containing protein [Saprospiraceae bacterium]
MKNQIVKIIVLLVIFWANANAQISGVVFRDINENGTREALPTLNEVGVYGAIINAYNSSGNLIASVSSDINGNYSFPASGANSLPSGIQVRLEFIYNSTSEFSGVVGSSNNSSVQFITAGTSASNVNYAINYPGDYCESAPRLAIPMYVSGDPLVTGTNAAGDINNYVNFPYNASGRYEGFCTSGCNSSGTPNIAISQAKNIGSVWGQAYRRTNKKLFSSSVLKRHVGIGPGGIGAIYITDISNALTPGTPSVFYDFGNAAGAGVVLSNSARNLVADMTQNSQDQLAFSQVGKVGFGDLDISDDETTLYVVNLFDRKVYSMNATGTTASSATALPDFPNPGCTGGVARPWGLEFNKGKLYLGVVCTAENGGTFNDLDGFIYEFNPATNSWNPTPVLTIDLTYAKGKIRTGENLGAKWYPWTDDRTNFIYQGGCDFCGFYHPQPLIGDLDFDEEGSLHIALLDRGGFQIGHRNSLPDNAALLGNGQSGGDVLRTYKNVVTGALILENSGVSGPYTSAGTGTSNEGPGGVSAPQGPGGGEFYWDDQIFNGFHSETSFGALAYRAGSKELFVTSMDPITLDAGGLQVYNTNNGNTLWEYQTYFGDATNEGTPGKANGIGDIELLCSPAPIEIGNRVWNDTDRDGVQDPGEATLSGVTVQLVKAGSVIATAVTNSTGNYYFSNATGTSTTSAIYNITQLMANMEYTVRIPNVTGGSKQSALGNLRLTTNGTGGAGQPDVRDSDGTLVGFNAEATVLTTDIPISGANNHSFDFGFMACPDTSYLICNNGIDSVKLTADAGVTNVMWYDSTSNTLVGTGSMLVVKSTTTGMSDGYEAYYYTATMPDGCQGILCCPVRVKTQTCITCSASVSQVTTQCNSNNTPANSSDDWFSVTLTGTISMGSGSYVVKVGAYTSPVTPSGTAITITGNGQAGNPLFQANGTSTYTLRIEDANNSNCFTTTTVGPVNACSSCPSPNCKTVTVTKS